MKVALVNPAWSFTGSTYFGCREPHLPLELGCTAALLEAAGHETLMLDGALDSLTNAQLADRAAAFAPDMTVVTTAPTYLFWRCAQPELRIPRDFLDALGARSGTTVAVGPHGSSTPQTARAKLGADIVVLGECEEVVTRLAEGLSLASIPSIAFTDTVTGPPASAHFTDLPPLRWPTAWLQRHTHHHHRYGSEGAGFGAEVEASRGCPYHCSFCAKIDFRDAYRRRDLAPLLAEIDGLIEKGVGYIYFVDEIFLPNRPLLEALVARPLQFGIQTRIDLWKPDMLDLLGAAGCVSIEAGVESLTEEGRERLRKQCRMSTDELADRLIHARRSVPFVQANLIEAAADDTALVAAWRARLAAANVWANDPVPLYPYPSSPDYHARFGAPDAQAWERAHAAYLSDFARFSDIQDEAPRPLAELEASCAC